MADATSHSQKVDGLEKLDIGQLEKELGTTPETGLTLAEAQTRLAQYGANEIAEKTTSPILKFLSYFWGPIPWMIEAAAVLSAIVHHWSDFVIIIVLLLANAIVGFWEEYQAGNAIAALKARLAPHARVKRGGAWSDMAARDLVPGDIVRLRLGDIVPADSRSLGPDAVEVDQAALTGESLPVSKGEGEVLYSGAILRQGEADAIVYATGGKTFFGKTAALVEEAHTTSHFQKAVMKIGDYLIIVAIALVTLIFAVATFRGDEIMTTLQFALVLTVAAIPVAMPAVLSVTMAVGARRLAARQAIVSRLASIEELAGVDVLCSDKTGTLTQNKLTLGDPVPVGGETRDELVLDGALASRAENQDTIDMAVIAGLKDQDALKAYSTSHYQPFDPVHKRTEATITDKDGKTFKVTKGAVQVVLALSKNAAAVKDDVDKATEARAKRGYRALGVAKESGNDWEFLGVLPLYDPPRPDSKDMIAKAEELGIDVKMVTGDQLAIAKEIAGQLGLGTDILDASRFGDTKAHETAKLDHDIETADGFAQVFPEHKFHIIDVLQKHGHIVGMTGDGVNDAPSLKKADCGIAVSGATDAARAAAAIVLLTPGLTVIVDAVKEARKIFQRMNSYAIYRIAETVRVLLFMTLSILVFNFYPVTAIMIVLLALLNDGAILSIAYDNVRPSPKPESWDMRLVLGVSTVLGITGVAASFGLFYIGEHVLHLDREVVQTLMYLKLSVAGHFNIFVTRTRGPFWSIAPAPILLIAVFGTQVIATVIAIYGLLMPAIGWDLAALVWGYAVVWFLINDRAKLLAYRILDHEAAPVIDQRKMAGM
ncbi:MAG: plasma-membrane proton-efflux P-type ATPase [Methyloceanibacter sp.]|uniref:plasma-membrane proton-efflux P-type ATPase n=1 Tax=Methyloceanibacter sp. TaxID=1965321 RepID=UPI001D971A87|nr:plasma-membrane proton-efflux P-type ATPase [Methyloceanibacter sp.]MCB1441844.1 plasma-membrane proton-efflux P-type ATPase [Methyloceanibacter sp.]